MSNEHKLVSIIITTKNEEEHIENCLKSVASQTYRYLELIVVDNNSEDLTKEIARKYTSLVFDKGPERSSQRNFGAKKAKGDYYLFLDADMMLSPKVIEECVKTVQNSESRIQNSKVGGIVIPEKTVGEGYWAKCKSLERACYLEEPSLEAARFFEKKIFWEFNGYSENITGPEDWDLPQRLKKKYKIGRIKNTITHNEGKISLSDLIKKKFYYGLKVPNYLENNHPLTVTAQQVIYLLRPAFYKNWRLLVRRPVITAGMIIMLFSEQIAGFAGFVKGSLRK